MAYATDFWISIHQVAQQGTGSFWDEGLKALEQHHWQAADDTRKRMAAKLDTAIDRLAEVRRVLLQGSSPESPNPRNQRYLAQKPGSAPRHS